MLPLDHGASLQYWIFTSKRRLNICFFETECQSEGRIREPRCSRQAALTAAPEPPPYITWRGEGCHLRVVPPGQLLRRPSTPKPFIEPGFSIFLTCSFFVFTFRWFRVFHWGCYVYFRIVFSFLYIFLYSYICFIYSYFYILYIFSLYLWCLTVLSRIMIALLCELSMTDPIPSCGAM